MSYNFYIINNEEVSKRNDTSSVDKFQKFTISAFKFIFSFGIDDNVIFQMLRDTSFNNISSKNSRLEYQIIAIKDNGLSNEKNKMRILDHFNSEDVERTDDDIKSISTFHIELNKINFDKSSYSTISKQNTITLELLVNNYNTDYYISNPSFTSRSANLSQILSNL